MWKSTVFSQVFTSWDAKERQRVISLRCRLPYRLISSKMMFTWNSCEISAGVTGNVYFFPMSKLSFRLSGFKMFWSYVCILRLLKKMQVCHPTSLERHAGKDSFGWVACDSSLSSVTHRQPGVSASFFPPGSQRITWISLSGCPFMYCLSACISPWQ